MGNIGDAISSGSIPAVGTAGTTYATNLNLFLTEVKTRLEAKMPKASLADGALDMNGSPLQNVSYVGVSNQGVAPTTPSNTIQAFGGNLYWINTGGAVQMTSGTSLNTALLGGITGDYGGANPAQFRFVDADQEYYAYDDFAGGAWARVWAKNFDIAAGNTSSQRARLAFGGAGSYTLTLPAALPGSTSIVQLSSAGDLTASNTIGSAVTVTGNVTATNLKHTAPKNRWFSHADFRDFGGVHSYQIEYWTLGNTSTVLTIPVTVENDEVIQEFGIYVVKNSDTTDTLTARLWRINDDGTKTQVGTNATNNANAPGPTLVFKDGLSETVGIGTGVGYVMTIERSDTTPSGAVLVNGAYIYAACP